MIKNVINTDIEDIEGVGGRNTGIHSGGGIVGSEENLERVLLENRFEFRAVSEEDIMQLYEWLKQSEVMQWYDDAKKLSFQEYKEKVIGKINSLTQFPYMMTLDGNPVGYIQCYDCLETDPEHWGGKVREGTFGIDLFIGELGSMMKGAGSLILHKFVENVVIGEHQAENVIIDPSNNNARAIRAFEKAGFIKIEDMGEEILMQYKAAI